MDSDDDLEEQLARLSGRSPDLVERTMKARGKKALFGLESEPILVGRFTVERRIGGGGMGTVFLARDATLKRSVALKLLRQASPEAAQEMLREGQAAARLAHPNVVSVYEAGSTDEGVYLALELVEGESLRHRLEGAPCDTLATLRIFAEAGRGLDAAHAAGLVHRDFKPDNVLVSQSGAVKVTDFGLARPLSDGRGGRSVAHTGAAGTPGYMAPEVLAGQPASPRSDQYAFCVSLYEALFGQRPCSGSAPSGPTPPKRVPLGLPAGRAQALWRVLQRGLAADPDQRFSSMAELLEALDRVRSPRRWAPLVVALLVACLVALLAALAWVAFPTRRSTGDPHRHLYEQPEFVHRPPGRCKKVCTQGKACGNGCIPWRETCHLPPGVACQGR